MECEHKWEFEHNWKDNIEFDLCLRIPIVCVKCGKLAHRTYTDFLITERDTGEEIKY